MASASEAECAAIFIDTRESIGIKTTLEEMGHPQLHTPIQVEKSTCDEIMNRKTQQKLSKSTDMQFYWVRDKVK